MITVLEWAPVLPWPLFTAVALIISIILLYTVVRSGRGAWWRASFFALILLALVDPQVVREQRLPKNDVAVVVIDRTDSQKAGMRTQQTDRALAALNNQLKKFKKLDVRRVTVENTIGDTSTSTLLFKALNQAKADIPPDRFAGAIFITDGQVHDLDQLDPSLGPIHIVLSGDENEMDRRLIIAESPRYALVDKPVEIVFSIQDTGFKNKGKPVPVTLRINDKIIKRTTVTPGRTARMTFMLDRSGVAQVSLATPTLTDELSRQNNQALFPVNGVRERLKVLLISGKPHAGERTWRNLLKSDPSVDLAHFTILRPPEKSDFTPLNELSLITFPVRELFETRLNDFDLIVFDRYLVRNVLPPSYMRGMNDYVRRGGAILFVVGPEYSQPGSLYNTPLSEILPFKPNGKVIEEGFRPEQTDVGRRHPVTSNLNAFSKNIVNSEQKPNWGRWFRQIDGDVLSGETLLSGVDGKPIMVLDRINNGRVAMLLSDQIWLWARGFEGGGPYGELIRKLAHWLMKEPELEEENLRARIDDNQLLIRRFSLSKDPASVTITTPTGAQQKVNLKLNDKGPATANISVSETGLFRIADQNKTVMVFAGKQNAPEFADLRSNAARAEKIAKLTGGGLFPINQVSPQVLRVSKSRKAAGKGWLGLYQNNAFVVKGSEQISAIPMPVFLLLGLFLLLGAWWREGQ